MSKRSRSKKFAPNDHALPAKHAEITASTDRRPSRLGGWRRWTLRIALAALAPAILLALIEGIMRIGGYGFPTSYLIKTDAGDAFLPNDKFIWQFYGQKSARTPDYFTLPPQKAPDTIRIFVLGESAALGTPEPAFSFCRILEVMLEQQYPDIHFEIINTALRGINSHIILPIARECTARQPDAFILYIGNNEVVGLHAPTPNRWYWQSRLKLARSVQWCRSTRLGQWLVGIAQKLFNRAPETQDMTFFRDCRLAVDDWRRQAVYRSFQVNLEDICRVITRSDAKTLLASVPSNLKDFPPFASLHQAELSPADLAEWDEFYQQAAAIESAMTQTNDPSPQAPSVRTNEYQRALVAYSAAAQIDDHFAELHWRLAQCNFALGNFTNAHQHYKLARDSDALAFRADGHINAAIRNVAAQFQAAGVALVDGEQAFAECELSEHGIAGQALIHDHVHLTFDGNYILARAFFGALTNALGEKLGPAHAAATGPPSRDQCAAALAYTKIDEFNVIASMIDQMSKPPFLDQADHAERQASAQQALRLLQSSITAQDVEQALALSVAAAEQRPHDWRVRFKTARLFEQFKRNTEAAAQLDAVVRMFPSVVSFRLALGRALANTGNMNAAASQFEEALRLDPDDKNAQLAMAWFRQLPSQGRQ